MQREVTASPREVISEERDISDSRNGEIKRPTRCAVHGSLLCYMPCTTWVRCDMEERGGEINVGARIEALSLEKMSRGWGTMRVPTETYRDAKWRTTEKNEDVRLLN